MRLSKAPGWLAAVLLSLINCLVLCFCTSVRIGSPLAVEVAQDVVVHETLRSLLRPAGAELIGSALFIFVSCGASMTTGLKDSYTVGAGTIGIALTSGMSIFVLAYAMGHISGGHLNFAVTLTFALLRKISPLKCFLYFLAQFFGGLIGIGFLKLVTPESWWATCFASNFIHAELTVGHALVAEFILSFFLLFVVRTLPRGTHSNRRLPMVRVCLSWCKCSALSDVSFSLSLSSAGDGSL